MFQGFEIESCDRAVVTDGYCAEHLGLIQKEQDQRATCSLEKDMWIALNGAKEAHRVISVDRQDGTVTLDWCGFRIGPARVRASEALKGVLLMRVTPFGEVKMEEVSVEVDGISFDVYRCRSGMWGAQAHEWPSDLPVADRGALIQQAIDAGVNKLAAQACPFWEECP